MAFAETVWQAGKMLPVHTFEGQMHQAQPSRQKPGPLLPQGDSPPWSSLCSGHMSHWDLAH